RESQHTKSTAPRAPWNEHQSAASPASFDDPFDSAVLFDAGSVIDEIAASSDPSPRRRSLLVCLIQGETLRLPDVFRESLNGARRGVHRIKAPASSRREETPSFSKTFFR